MNEAIAAGDGLGLEDEPGRRRLGLGEHDREQDQDADRADVDEHLGGGEERRAEEDVDPGQRARSTRSSPGRSG